MEDCRELTPVESAALLKLHRVRLAELKRLTALHLMFKGVIGISTPLERGFLSERRVAYVGPGPRFEEAVLLPHEEAFRVALYDCQVRHPPDRKENQYHISRIGNFVGMACSRTRENFYDRVFRSLRDRGLIREESRMMRFLSDESYRWTARGKRMAESLRMLVRRGEQELPKCFEEDPARARGFVMAIGANVLLLHKLDEETWQKIFEIWGQEDKLQLNPIGDVQFEESLALNVVFCHMALSLGGPADLFGAAGGFDVG